MKNLWKIIGLLWMSYPLCSMAKTYYTTYEGSRFELSALVGGSYIPNTIDGQKLELLPYEIGPYADTFTNQSGAGAFTWGLDAKYRFKLHYPSNHDYFFDSIGAGIDVFQITSFEQTGDVLQFGLPEFKNYTYTLTLSSTRIMADFDLDFHPIGERFIPFIEGGIGSAGTTVSYSSSSIAGGSPGFNLSDESSWHFAYQVGAGMKYVVNPHVLLSFLYLYANMGQVDSSTSGSTTTLATPLTVDMSTQNFYLGFTYGI